MSKKLSYRMHELIYAWWSLPVHIWNSPYREWNGAVVFNTGTKSKCQDDDYYLIVLFPSGTNSTRLWISNCFHYLEILFGTLFYQLLQSNRLSSSYLGRVKSQSYFPIFHLEILLSNASLLYLTKKTLFQCPNSLFPNLLLSDMHGTATTRVSRKNGPTA